ncbi:hypothetical protein KAR91_52385 [Candidatus Pacearchaeota archaeon]|nr:hypothetical protein [Candidatus Pacearchaeota archaeon]
MNRTEIKVNDQLYVSTYNSSASWTGMLFQRDRVGMAGRCETTATILNFLAKLNLGNGDSFTIEESGVYHITATYSVSTVQRL